MSVHLTKSGAWEACSLAPNDCTHLHVPLDSVEEALALPRAAYEQLVAPFADTEAPTVLMKGSYLTDPIAPISNWRLDGSTKLWRNEDRLYHRDYDLPAVIEEGVSSIWYQQGRIHRENDRPAIVRLGANDLYVWMVDGKFHRDGGKPAIINGLTESWYEHGKRMRRSVCSMPGFNARNQRLWAKDNDEGTLTITGKHLLKTRMTGN